MPRKNQRQPGSENLIILGMTDAQIDLWFALPDVAGRLWQLPILHPMEREETCHDLHQLQNRLLARPGLRAIGWPRQETAQPE